MQRAIGRNGRRTRRGALLAAAVLALAALALPASALADTALEQDFESGLGGWTADGLWHVETSPQAISVLSPQVNPNLVTLPDAGGLPPAHQGSSVAWFGDRSSGTFCGNAAHVSSGQAPKNGCSSSGTQAGSLTSPAFDLSRAVSAQIEFWSWWEIEGVDADRFDVMTIEYSTNGSTWTEAGKLNPSDDANAEHHEPYTANGVRRAGSWHRYVADLTGAIGNPSVRVRFRFDSRDSAYQGFRGWLVDSVTVETPYAEPAPRIDAIAPECVRPGESRIIAVEGEHFVLGSTVQLDGRTLTSATPSSTRMEFVAPSTLGAGGHPIKVVLGGAHAAESNVAYLQVRADCAAKRITATQVRCDRGPNPWDPSRCTATVGDADVPQRRTPAGRVRFSSADGAFTRAYECQLTPTPLSPGVASCAVQNVPAGRDGFASVRADYLGSDDHLPSSATTGFILASGSGPPVDPDEFCAAGPRAGASVVNDYHTFNQPGLDFGDVGFCFKNLAIDSIQGVTHVIEGATYVAPPAIGVAVGIAEPIPLPQARIAAGTLAAGAVYYVTIPIRSVNQHVYRSLATTQQDPPDPKYRRLAKPRRRPRVATLVAQGKVTRKHARRLTRMVRQFAVTGELAQALTATLDRAGGAKLANDTAWEARQMRHALKLAPRLANQMDRSARAIAGARRLAKRYPAFKRPYKLKTLKRTARRIVKRGWARPQVRLMRALGATKRDLRTIRRGQKTTLRFKRANQLPLRRPLDLLGKRSVESLRTGARALRYWAVLPEVTELADPGRG